MILAGDFYKWLKIFKVVFNQPDSGPYLPLAGGTMTGPIVLSGLPVENNQAASKQYVDLVAAGLAFTVNVATTANFASTYSNGAAGVGATLTATSTGAVSFDGQTVVLNDTVLVKSQTAPAQNGLYLCTTAGDVGVAMVLTRSTDYDTPTEINNGGIIFVGTGTTLGDTFWFETAVVTTIGTDPISYVSVGAQGTVTSITADDGITATPNPITGAGTIGLSNITNSAMLANISGSAAPPVPVLLTAYLDTAISEDQGSLITRKNTQWLQLAPGTAGLPLVSGGAGEDLSYEILSGAGGGTGVDNTGKTITLGGNLTTSGAFNTTFTVTADTNVTFPTSGTLATVGASVSSITGTADQVIASSPTGDVTLSLPQSIATTSSPTFNALTLTTQLTTPMGGTGQVQFTTYGILYGNNTNPILAMAAGADGQIIQGNTGSPPSYTRTPIIGLNASTTGTIRLRGATSGTVTIQPQSVAGTFSFNIPVSAGSAPTSSTGQVMQSGGGGSTAMSWMGYDSANTASTLMFRNSSGATAVASITSAIFAAATSNVATAGDIRLSTDGSISFRTEANDGNVSITKNTSDIFVIPTNLNITGLTASELVATDASKNLQSLAVATYPSLTEISYVKGVTSSIQAQIDALSPVTPEALTKNDDTNVTLTLGGTPATALLQAVSLTLGWTGLLGLARGGVNADLSGTGGTSRVLMQTSAGAAITVAQLAASNLSNGTTGSGAVVLATGPSLTTPDIGAATGTSLNLSGLTASYAVVTDGSKNLASLQYTSANTASTLIQRDGSGNFSAGTITATLTGAASAVATADDTSDTTCFPLFVNASGTQSSQAPKTNANYTFDASLAVLSAVNIRSGYTTTATAAGTTTLTNASTRQQYFTGTTTQTVVLPVTSTLALGWKFEIYNNSTGLVTLQSSGANTIRILEPGSSVVVTCILTSGTGVASWSAGHASAAAGALYTNNQTGTTYTFALTDGGATVTASNASASTYTLPQTSNVAFPIGTRIKLVNLGAGAVTLVKEGSETLLGNVLLNQYATSMIEKTSATQWQVFGGTAVISEAINGSAVGTIVNQAYDISVRMPFGGTIISNTLKTTTTTTAGTYTVAISGVSVTGLTTVVPGASGVRTNTSATAANTFVTGDYITITFAGATITDAFWTLEYTRAY